MTDTEFELLKERIKHASYLRGKISFSKKRVTDFTHLESVANVFKKEEFKKKTIYWIGRLESYRKQYSEI